mmetsp:Transcript_16144/g.47061  ORF Transcript_16144/g.47061 Transcript_16144/m.47061 type:complete len:347 (-) Transcript_16144:86-1126(-)|eukprot:CAMPEP_0168373450 /NCGR_PEP_ID=MMETSP0228-20121227/8795_1 /TAXON_ID=133427 /ORGANISM="Protoceratium reticulatum, Strain CCCM 535 (=CCMP 1889)" /LENGTH=346 /DNA_ID=CAMNT_0008386373 /DNA_START=208 /DNA_END=1248 /DNA_ORIENTATION=+
MKQGEVAVSSGTKKGGASSAGQGSGCTLKILAPEALAAAIIGKGGAVIAAMRSSCQAKIALTEHAEVYPQTDCRVLTAQAGSEESLNDVSRQIIAKVAELAKVSKDAEAVGQDTELKLRTVVPRAAVGGIIGKGGATIKQIRETSGAKVSISEPLNGSTGPSAEQLVAVTGPAQALEYVLVEVNKQIQALRNEPWFAAWATTQGAGRGMASAPGASYSALAPMANVRGGPLAGIDIMLRVANSLPPYVMEDSRGFALSCVVPNRLVGGLIGRGGSGTKEVQMITGTKIGIREIPDDPDNRSLNIAGPLSNACAAYMLMMKRYLDAEAAGAGSADSRGGTDRAGAQR